MTQQMKVNLHTEESKGGIGSRPPLILEIFQTLNLFKYSSADTNKTIHNNNNFKKIPPMGETELLDRC